MESINIKALVERCAKGEASGFAVLYEHLIDRIFSFVASRVNGRDDAIEVTQDSFIELHKALSKFTYKSDAEFYGFVFTIVRRQLAKYYFMDNKHKTSEINENTLRSNLPDIELTQSVRSALETLDERTREIVVLHHWSRFTFAEIGSIINMTESAVRVRHHRALAALASVLNA